MSLMSFFSDFLTLQTVGHSWIIAAVLVGYVFGSVPFGLILTRFAGLGDIRAIGSGNTGATNVLRAGNRKIAILTLLCDIAKGAIPTAFFTLISPNLGMLAGFCAFIGHIFPIWLKFNGGKGVATYLGALLAASWSAAIVFAIIWLFTAWYRRYSSLAALTAAAASCICAFFTLLPFAFLLCAAMTVIIFIRHRSNITRLLSGTEAVIKINKKK